MAGATADSPRWCLTAHTLQMLLLLALQARSCARRCCGGAAGRRASHAARSGDPCARADTRAGAAGAQTSLLVALLVAPALPHLPPDATGHEAALAAFVRANLPRVRAVLAASLALNALALLLAAVLSVVARADCDRRAACSCLRLDWGLWPARAPRAPRSRCAPPPRSDDEEDGLASPSGTLRRITLSGETRLALGHSERLLPPPEPQRAAAAPSYTQRMCVRGLRACTPAPVRAVTRLPAPFARSLRRRERYAGDDTPPQRASPARPRRLTPEALAATAAPPENDGGGCSLM
jgi:hypothetical protein